MNRKIKSKRNNDEIGYWQSIADMLAALLLIILLVVVLLVLYIIRVPDDEFVDMFEGDAYHGYEDPDAGGGDYAVKNPHDADDWDDGDDEGNNHLDDGGGGGGDGGGDRFEYPEMGHGEDDGLNKAAVYVMVIDTETQRTIKEEGITFELYSDENALQILNTYYPVKVEYRDYETNEVGVFYLPEKLEMGRYYFRELTEPLGYDAAPDQYMDIYLSYDWPEPYILKIPLSPSKNIIRIQNKDMDSGDPVFGGSYDIVAAEDIITADGTLRYANGQVVEKITCDTNGYAESQPVYLGKYLVRQSDIPQYYAGDPEPLEVEVEKRSGDVLPAIHEILCEKTTVSITLADELYGNIRLNDVPFSLTFDGNPSAAKTVYTDNFGALTLTDFNKNTTYHLRQLQAPEGYVMDEEDHAFHVSGVGRFEEEKAKLALDLFNRTLRVQIGIKDIILQSQVSDYNVALYDDQGNLIEVWNSTGLSHNVAGLMPGRYILRLNGSSGRQKYIQVEDQLDVQVFQYNVWTPGGMAAVAGITAVAVALIIFAVLSAQSRRRAKREKQKEAEEEEARKKKAEEEANL